MIGPRMATMLAFLLTDAPVRANDLQEILADAVDRSFNCLSVEGHASTNDTVLLLSSTAGDRADPAGRGRRRHFAGMVRSACESLARQIADDGEGATHFITIDVEGCRTTEDARAIARAVADSPLVKTAIHGADPNWGRIVSAAGYAGVSFEEEELSLWINEVPVYRRGAPCRSTTRRSPDRSGAAAQVDLRLTLDSGRSRCPILDVRPDGRVRPAQRGLHDLSGGDHSDSGRRAAHHGFRNYPAHRFIRFG